jgi:hypothetical protein
MKFLDIGHGEHKRDYKKLGIEWKVEPEMGGWRYSNT